MNTRKKILYVITKSNWGGAQRYVYDLATSLPHDHFDVAVACGGDGLFVQKLKEQNIKTCSIRSFQRDISFTKECLSFFELLDTYRTYKPDVVHLNSSKAGGLGALAARIAGVKKIIFTVHGWPFWEPRGAVQQVIIRILSYLTVALSHVTVCISEHDARTGRRMPFLKQKIHVIRNGLAPYTLLTKDEARAKLFGQDVIAAHENDLWVLTNAELTKNKNVRAGIDAVLLHNKHAPRKIFYVLMGDGEQYKSLLEYATKKNACNFVSFLGFVENGRIYYRGFDAFLLPSLKEGVPYVLLEAGVAELPCIATNTGGIPEVIENGKNGFVEPKNDTSALANALEKLSQNESIRAEFGKKYSEKIVRDYSFQTMLEKTFALYI